MDDTVKKNCEFNLGVDIGTTSLKIVLIDQWSRKVIQSVQEPLNATIKSPEAEDMQDAGKIVSTLVHCLSKFEKLDLAKVKGVGVCGQMHGVVLWNDQICQHLPTSDLSLPTFPFHDYVSPLFTWQDARCTATFLESLPQPSCSVVPHSGYGCSTLFWLSKYKPEFLRKYNKAGTIMDFIVSLICGSLSVKPKISVQNAASWGYLNLQRGQWDFEILEENNFPVHLLPKITPSNSVAGNLSKSWFDIPENTLVGVAWGDLQCSFLSTQCSERQAVLNISTSAQLAILAPTHFLYPRDFIKKAGVDHYPFFDGRFLIVAASLNGGNALETLINSIKLWTSEFGVQIPETILWEKCKSLAEADVAETSLKVIPTFLGERHNPNQTASIINIRKDNFTLAQLFKAFCRGVAENLHSMISEETLREFGVRSIIGVGSALSRNRVLQNEIKKVYKLDSYFDSDVDSALGAALAINNIINSTFKISDNAPEPRKLENYPRIIHV